MSTKVKWLFTLVAVCVCIPLNSFSITDSESYVKEFKNLSSFRRLYVSAGSLDIELVQGNRSEVKLEGDKEVVEQLEVKVLQGELDIIYKSGSKRAKNSKVKATITTKTLTGITARGSVTLSSDKTWKVSSLSFLLSGSGEFSLPVNATSLRVQISGSSTLKLTGNVKTQTVAITGSGQYNGGDLKSNTTTVVLSGSGSATVFAKESLNATIYGSGDVTYKGSPQIQTNIFGSGKVEKDSLL